jgi:hypothetical protein
MGKQKGLECELKPIQQHGGSFLLKEFEVAGGRLFASLPLFFL